MKLKLYYLEGKSFMVNPPSSEDTQNGLQTALIGFLLDITTPWIYMT